MKIVCISDTHNTNYNHPRLAGLCGDLLVHAGDLTSRGTLDQLQAATDWLRSLKFKHKVVVAGNHDVGLQLHPEWASTGLFDGLTYLNQSETVVAGLRVYGTPWSPYFMNWAFNASPEQAKANADLIPAGLDILVTHGPPYGHGDKVEEGQHVGCPYLATRIESVRPRLVVCGHIHEARGSYTTVSGIQVINASVLNRQYYPAFGATTVSLA